MKMDRSTLRALALATQLGFSIAASLGLGILGGLWVDERLGTRPIFLLLGMMVGLVSAAYMMRDLVAFERNSDEEEDGSSSDR
jgi:F0F1-type ATP synthase assembly protein I